MFTRRYALVWSAFAAAVCLFTLFNLSQAAAWKTVSAPIEKTAETVFFVPAAGEAAQPRASAPARMSPAMDELLSPEGAATSQQEREDGPRPYQVNMPTRPPARWAGSISYRQSQPATTLQRKPAEAARVAAPMMLAMPERQAPAAILAPPPALTFTMEPLHRGAVPGYSSAFVISNTSGSTANFVLDYYWPSGDHLATDVPAPLAAGESQVFMLDNAPFGESNFYGSVYVSSDQPLTGEIVSPMSGAAGGVIYAPDGVTPVAMGGVSIFTHPSNDWFGNIYTLGDGSYYLGGLADTDYKLFLHGSYPWASQYYSGHVGMEEADVVAVHLGSLTSVDFILQPGGQISGTVFAEDGVTPLENINVDLAVGGYGTCTDALGNYVIDGVPYGDHVIRAGGDWNWCTEEQSTYLTEFYLETWDFSQATPISINGGSDLVGEIDFTLSSGGVIRGRVTSSVDGTPLEGIWINANEYDSGWYGQGASSDASGYYTITGLLDLDYRVGMDDWDSMISGWAWQYYPDVLGHDQASRVTVSGGGTVSDIDFGLQPGGVISGTISEQGTGTPLASINLDINPVSGEWGSGSCSDGSGTYMFAGLPYGDYKVSSGGYNHCQNGENSYAREYYDQANNWDSAAIVTVSGSPATGINFTLEPGATIAGRVTDASSGLPLANVGVNVNSYDDNQGFGNADTDSSGYYTVTGVAAGDYRLAVNDPNRIPDGYAMQYYDQTRDYNSAGRVTVSSGGLVTGIDFQLEPGGVITGYVRDDGGQPLAGINLNFSAVNADWGHGSCSDQDGYYEMRALPYHEYVASAANGWNFCTNQPNSYVAQFFDHQPDWNSANSITLDSGTTLYTEINFDLAAGGYIVGHVADALNAPVAGLHVMALRAGNQQWAAGSDTDINGDYQLEALAPGDYVVQACAGCSGHLLVDEYYNDVYHFNDAQLLNVTAGSTVSGIDFALDQGVLLSGHISVPDGYSSANMPVDAWQTIPWGYGTGRQTDSNGDYVIPVPPIFDSGWAVQVRPDGTDLGAQRAHDFDLSRQTNWDFDLELGAQLSGCLSDGGAPVPNVQVGADAPEIWQGAQTGQDGCYTIYNLPAASYRVTADDWGSGRMQTFYGGHDYDWATEIHLKPGDSFGGVDFEYPLAGAIEGLISDNVTSLPIEGVRVAAMNDHGFWYGWSQPDGVYHIDVPVGEFKLQFQSEGGEELPLIYSGGAHTFASATPVTVTPLPDVTTADQAMFHFATLSGQVTDAGSSTPLGGILVSALNIDAGVGRDYAGWSDCTNETGQYHIPTVYPGETVVMATGSCGDEAYGLVTQTVTAVAGQNQVLNLNLTATNPKRPFTVRVGESYDYTPLSSATWDWNEEVLPALFEPLVALDDSGHWFSELLTQVPTSGNGGAAIVNGQLVVSYTLKSGLFWSDGEPLTSADIKLSWEMNSTPYPAYTLWPPAQVGQRVISVETPDGLTAVVAFEPGYRTANYLEAIRYPLPAHLLAGIHPQDIRFSSQFAHQPVGNGPYMVEKWVPGGYLDLTANPNYHKRDQGLPRLEKVRFLYGRHPFWAVLSGNAQVSLEAFDYPPGYADFPVTAYESFGASYDSFLPNHSLPFFADAQVRRALSYAMDREYIASVSGRPAGTNWLAPDHHMVTGTVTYPFDLGTAAALLDAAGWIDSNASGLRDKDGVEFSFDLVYNEGNETRRQAAARFQSDLATLGIDANVVSMPWGDMLEASQRGQLDAVSVGWRSDHYYSPEDLLLNLHSDTIPTPYNNFNGSNWSGWSDSANDALIEAAADALDDAALRALVAQEQQLFAQEQPFWVHSHYNSMSFATPILRNFKPSAATPGTWNIEEWYLPANPYDLSVRTRLSTDSPAPQPGTVISYVLTVRNEGSFTVTNATLFDTLPAAVNFQAATPAPYLNDGSFLGWHLGDMAPGATAAVRVRVEIPGLTAHGTVLVNSAETFGNENDTQPGNNGFVHQATVRDDVDLALIKSGVGQPAVGESYEYYIDYANWGGAPADSVLITDTLPPEVNLISADPAPVINGSQLSWELGTLPGNQWGGQIKITAEITDTGTVVNTAVIGFPAVDVDLGNNSDDHSEMVEAILPPLITQPTQGTTGLSPTVKGWAPSESTVDLWDISVEPATWIMSDTADIGGSWVMTPTLAPGSYSIAARATKVGLTSGNSNSASITVDGALDIDPDHVRISSEGVDISAGVVRAERRTLPRRLINIEAVLDCALADCTARLSVKENGLLNYTVPAVSKTAVDSTHTKVTFRLYLSEPHSTYDIWLEWGCDGSNYRENLLYILIDPDGYVYDQSMVTAGSSITDSIILDAVVTAYVKVGSSWVVWPAAVYGQVNPQSTDGSTDDGVITAGYYSFLTPPGQYRIKAAAPGFQPYQSPVLTVIQEPVHLDIGMLPVVAESGQSVAPANLNGSAKWTEPPTAWLGDTVTFHLDLANSGSAASGQLSLSDAIPTFTSYVSGTLALNGAGVAAFNVVSNTINWQGSVPAHGTVEISYQLVVDGTPGNPFDAGGTVQASGGSADLFTLGDLTAYVSVLNQVGVAVSSAPGQSADPGETVAYQHVISNSGNSTDTFSLAAESSAGWSVGLPSPVTLGAGMSTTVQLTMTPPENALYGDVDETVVTVSSDTSPGVTAVVTESTSVNLMVGVSLAAAPPQSGEPGQVVSYSHQLRNSGNYTDSFTVTVLSSLGWQTAVNTPILLGPGEAIDLLLAVTVPLDAADGQVDSSTVTVTSAADSQKQSSAVDVTTVSVTDYQVFLPAIMRAP